MLLLTTDMIWRASGTPHLPIRTLVSPILTRAAIKSFRKHGLGISLFSTNRPSGYLFRLYTGLIMKRREFCNPYYCYLEAVFGITLMTRENMSLLTKWRLCLLAGFERSGVLLCFVFFFFALATRKLRANLVFT